MPLRYLSLSSRPEPRQPAPHCHHACGHGERWLPSSQRPSQGHARVFTKERRQRCRHTAPEPWDVCVQKDERGHRPSSLRSNRPQWGHSPKWEIKNYKTRRRHRRKARGPWGWWGLFRDSTEGTIREREPISWTASKWKGSALGKTTSRERDQPQAASTRQGSMGEGSQRLSHQGNANQSNSATPAAYPSEQPNPGLCPPPPPPTHTRGEDTERQELPVTAGGNSESRCSRFGRSAAVSHGSKHPPPAPAIALLGVYPKELTTYVHTKS